MVYARNARREGNRIGITVSTKVGNAVTRNSARRRIKECYRRNEDKFKLGSDIVFVARGRAVNIPYAELEREMLLLAGKLELLKHDVGDAALCVPQKNTCLCGGTLFAKEGRNLPKL